MSDSMKTSLSAFVDGAASSDESSNVLKQLTEDEEMQSEWQNYHTIAAVLRNEDISSLQPPTDWDILASTLPSNGDVLSFQRRNRVTSMFVHGGIGAGLAACIMVAMFFMFPNDPNATDPSLAINKTTESNASDPLPQEAPPQQLTFDEMFELGVASFPAEIHEDLRQMMLEALHAHDVSRSGIDGSLMHDASVVSRNVSQEL